MEIERIFRATVLQISYLQGMHDRYENLETSSQLKDRVFVQSILLQLHNITHAGRCVFYMCAIYIYICVCEICIYIYVYIYIYIYMYMYMQIYIYVYIYICMYNKYLGASLFPSKWPCWNQKWQPHFVSYHEL